MRVGFAGTPAFAVTALAAIADAGFTIPLVLTRPDKPKGRGLKIEPSPVSEEARRRGLPVLRPASLKTPEGRSQALAVPLDVLVVAAYGLILPPEVLAWPRHGCLNIHASKLPRWRGAAPIQRAILAGDAATGVAVMQMDAGLDTGPVVAAVDVPIGPRETAGSLHDTLALAGARLVVDVLSRLARDGRLEARPQATAGVEYARRIERGEARIEWAADAVAIDRLVRAFDPAPGAFTLLRGAPLKVWRAVATPGDACGAPPGTVLSASARGIVVACGRGTLAIEELQPAGARRMSAAAFVAGRGVEAGTLLGGD
ncbi:MAG: methionyl-tRNA formyltransferase [Betaproteobacteria bacterium]|jgi:methionyl-tRNA formyltransferase|nr:methionyl-tRNA formyltransferase [Betaproteobacteria bacterium]